MSILDPATPHSSRPSPPTLAPVYSAAELLRMASDDARDERDRLRDRSIRKVYLAPARIPPEALAAAASGLRRGGIAVAAYLPSLAGSEPSPSPCPVADESAIEAQIRSLACLFDELLIGPPSPSRCECAECRKRKGRRSWRDYRQSATLNLVRRRVVAPARETNPSVTLGLAVSSFGTSSAGFHPASISPLFDRVIVAAPSRPGAEEAGADAYLLFRWLAEIVGRKVAGVRMPGGPIGERAADAVLAGATELLVPADPDDSLGGGALDRLIESRPLLGDLAAVAKTTPRRGVAAYRPLQVYEEREPGRLGELRRCGFPLRPTPRFPSSSKSALFTADALDDPRLVPELNGLLDSGGVAAGAPETLRGLESREGGAELIPRLIRIPESVETLEPADAEGSLARARDLLLAPLGVRFSAAPGGVLSLFGHADAVVQNGSPAPAEFHLSLGEKRLRVAGSSDPSLEPGEEAERLVLSPSAWVHLRG